MHKSILVDYTEPGGGQPSLYHFDFLGLWSRFKNNQFN